MSNFLSIVFVFFALVATAQPTVKIAISGNGPVTLSASRTIDVPASAATANVFNLLFSNIPAADYPLSVLVNGVAQGSTIASGIPLATIGPLQQSLIGKIITINKSDGTKLVDAKIVANVNNAVNGEGGFPTLSVMQELERLFPTLSTTEYGLGVPASALNNTVYKGDNYTHIFFDQFGNSLISTVPQGIANRQYVVHIIYLTDATNPSKITFGVNQLSGEFDESLVFMNDGGLNLYNNQGGGGATPQISYQWAHQEFLLSTSTKNIEFEIIRNVLDDSQVPLATVKSTIAKYTIKMSKVYHGSFTIGLHSSWLADPTFDLLEDPNNSAQMVVRQTDKGNRGIVTAMATFYTSPIILLEKYVLRKDIPSYKLSGRNFLDDHKIYERIYPAVGVVLNDKVFQNLVFGLNWEIARGGSLFVGAHYGRVNTFNPIDDEFSFGSTPYNQAQFDYALTKQWRMDWVIGANLDLLVIGNLLFGSFGAGGGQ